jgi:hypothetical protein
MPAPSLSTPAARIELRDLATAAFHETADGSQDNRAGVCAAASAITDLGFLVATDARPSASSFATITVTACDGSTLTLDWDPMLDGFDYATSGDDGCDLDEIEANTEDEPECVNWQSDLRRDMRGWGGAQRVEQIAVEVAPTIIDAPRTPATEIQNALRGLTAEQKVVAMATALTEAGVTLHRDTDPGDGSPAIGATLPDGSTCTVLTIERPVPFITDAEIRRLDLIVAASLKPEYSGWNIIDISGHAYCDLETVGHIEIPARYTATNRPVVIDRKNLS